MLKLSEFYVRRLTEAARVDLLKLAYPGVDVIMGQRGESGEWSPPMVRLDGEQTHQPRAIELAPVPDGLDVNIWTVADTADLYDMAKQVKPGFEKRMMRETLSLPQVKGVLDAHNIPATMEEYADLVKRFEDKYRNTE